MADLEFVQEVFKKAHLGCTVTASDTLDVIYDGMAGVACPRRDAAHTWRILPKTLYKLTDPFGRGWCILRPDGEGESTKVIIGPFLHTRMTEGRLSEIAERVGIQPSPKSFRYMMEYYTGLPIINESSPILLMIETLCERIWGSRAFVVRDLDGEGAVGEPFAKTMLDVEPTDTLVSKRAIEQRYTFENEMIRAVTLGQAHVEQRFHAAFVSEFFERRAKDPLRNAKNYAVIMNTLLRKAAERGGVHPIHLDRTSSEFATRIEDSTSLSSVPYLMGEMFRTYCRLVRERTLREYSTTVQKTILIIDADLSADLSPSLLAKSQGITLSYLSSAFKRDTGMTITEYILSRRIEYAEYLLTTTDLEIQTVALHCGIMDAQYFSKLFKKRTGKTPTSFRKSPDK